jgi:hypothetical protein
LLPFSPFATIEEINLVHGCGAGTRTFSRFSVRLETVEGAKESFGCSSALSFSTSHALLSDAALLDFAKAINWRHRRS